MTDCRWCMKSRIFWADSLVAPKLSLNSLSVGRLSLQTIGVCTAVMSSCPKSAGNHCGSLQSWLGEEKGFKLSFTRKTQNVLRLLTYHDFSVQILATAWAVQQVLPPPADLTQEGVAAQSWVWLLRCVEGPERKTVMLAHFLVGYCDGAWRTHSNLMLVQHTYYIRCEGRVGR